MLAKTSLSSVILMKYLDEIISVLTALPSFISRETGYEFLNCDDDNTKLTKPKRT
jgi:hypothetical protein